MSFRRSAVPPFRRLHLSIVSDGLLIGIMLVGASLYGQTAQLSDPTPGSQLTAGTVTFQWLPATGAGPIQYWLDIGYTPGDGTYFAQQTASTSVQVSSLPIDGRTLYVGLYTSYNGVWQPRRDYQLTAVNLPDSRGTLTNPAPGSVLSSSSALFTWTAASGAPPAQTEYWLDVGTSFHNGTYFGQLISSGTSVTVNNLPSSGQPLFVTLFTRFYGV